MKDESKMSANPKTIAEAYDACTKLARAHYENFPVGRLVPREMQPHVHAVYAFARYAAVLDIPRLLQDAKAQGARNVMTPEQRLAALDDWERQLCSRAGTPGLHFIFIALHETIRELNLPLGLFTDLLSAFKQDVVKRRYADFSEVLDYCRRSANPVGRLVLLLHGVRDENTLESAIAAAQNVYLYGGGDMYEVAAAYAYHLGVAILERRSSRRGIGVSDPVRCGIASSH